MFDIEKLSHYMETYDEQQGYETYTSRTYTDDILYGLGISINQEKYQHANGFEVFKADLIKFINGSDRSVFDE